ncbi:YdeI/OmpD-associated family protein [Lactococcus cremoris]
MLSEALAKNLEAKEVFEQLTASKQLEINRYIARLKTDEAIERNVDGPLVFSGKESVCW